MNAPLRRTWAIVFKTTSFKHTNNSVIKLAPDETQKCSMHGNFLVNPT